MRALEVILTLLPHLDEEEKREVARGLNNNPCYTGHKFKHMTVQTEHRLFHPSEKKIVMYCERCGELREVTA